MTNSNTQLELRDRSAWLTIDDGKVNVMSIDLLREVGEQMDAAAQAANVIVLLGRPGIFSAGFDLKALARGTDAARELLDAGIALITKFLTCPVPVVVGCTGHAYPMGAFLLLSADVRVGVEGDWRIGLNEVAIGITLPKFALALARHRLTPAACARIRTGTLFDPCGAAAAGYVDEVVPATRLVDRCAEIAAQVSQVDPTAYVATKARIVEPLLEAIRTEPY